MRVCPSRCEARSATRPEDIGRLTATGSIDQVTEEEIIAFAAGLPGTVVVTAGPENDAPEVAWGDSFFFYDPAGDVPANQRMPYATVVTSDYPGWDTASALDREGVFRVNVAVGRTAYQELISHHAADHAAHHDEFDYSAPDVILPHPVYATQGWVSVLNPAERTRSLVRRMLQEAHASAKGRDERRHSRDAGHTDVSD